MEEVELGFLEESEDWRLESYMFPSKVGGKPAWLSLDCLPTAKELQCNICERPMIFLCQLYAPFEENSNASSEQLLNNFHRIVYVFICRNSNCCVRNKCENIKVLRSSLSRENKFYSFDPPSEDMPNKDFSVEKWINVCQVCGIYADKKCSSCKNIYYCSRQHQLFDWKENHKQECGKEINTTRKSKLLFLEREILIEHEELNIINPVELEKYEQMAEKSKNGSMANFPENELEAYSAKECDKFFSKFQKRIKCNPDQIIRYKKSGMPLWIAKEPLPENIPNCEYCNGPRQFEFQIMPQLLTFLQENDIDWGVIAVYTCVSSCTNSVGYKNEFVFKQDVELNNIT